MELASDSESWHRVLSDERQSGPKLTTFDASAFSKPSDSSKIELAEVGARQTGKYACAAICACRPLGKAACFSPVCVLLLCSALPWPGLLCVCARADHTTECCPPPAQANAASRLLFATAIAKLCHLTRCTCEPRAWGSRSFASNARAAGGVCWFAPGANWTVRGGTSDASSAKITQLHRWRVPRPDCPGALFAAETAAGRL